METYGKILLMAMPAFLALVLFEKWYGWRRGYDTVRQMDMISSMSSGITNVTKDVLGLSVAILAYPFLLKHLAVFNITTTWLVYLVAFLALDFAGYWGHRFQHQYNVFWNAHLVHHSSEEFNLACALRQSISGIVKVFGFLLLPAAVFGVSANVIAVVAPLHLFAQFWYHTRHINRMGFLEHIIVTPSHHRVHHAINPQYIDKNYGQIFIFWDKWFGTFQQELPSEPPVYGITVPVQTWNPIKINFLHIWQLAKDAWRTQNMADKWRIWLMPTGWRPADVQAKYPLHKINDVHRFSKYDPATTPALVTWAWVQLVVMLLIISHLFAHIAQIGAPAMFWYGGFVFLSVYAYTELMDNNRYAPWLEGAKNAIGIAILLATGDWFGAAGNYGSWIKYALMGYFVASTAITALLAKQLRQKLARG